MKKTNLFIIGEPKSGTTALYKILNTSSKIFFPEEKEPEFFSTDLHKSSDKYHKGKKFFHYRKLSDYQKLYLGKSNYLWLGDASTHYAFSKNAAKNIHEYNAEAKIIYIVREPITFLASLHSQYLVETSEDTDSFIQALEKEDERKKGKMLPKYVRAPEYVYYKERIKYYNHLARYKKYFRDDQILVLLQEDLWNNYSDVIVKVKQFLNLSENEELQTITTNTNKKLRFKYFFLIIQNPSLKRTVRKLIPLRVYNKLKKIIFKIFYKYSPREKLPEEYKLKLQKKIKPELIKFGRLINRPLVKIWDYK